MLLYPVQEEAAVAGAEQVEHHKHHPHTEGCRHYKILRTRASQLLKLGTGEAIKRLAVDSEAVVYSHSVDIMANGLDDAVAHEIAVYAVALGIIGKQKLYPTGPEEHRTCQAEARLACVALDKDTPNGDDKTEEAHGKSRIVKYSWSKVVLHNNHKRMPKGHKKQDNKQCSNGLARICFSFHIFVRIYIYH